MGWADRLPSGADPKRWQIIAEHEAEAFGGGKPLHISSPGRNRLCSGGVISAATE